MVVSERYACFWSLFNLRFSLYGAQFIMLTLFKFTSFTFTTNLDFSLLFNPHLLWFLYLFSVVLFFPLSRFPLGVELVFVWPVRGEWCFLQIAIQSRKIGNMRLFAPWKCESGFGKTAMREGLVWLRHLWESPLRPLAGMAATPSCPPADPSWAPCMSACWLDSGVPTETPGQPHSEGKESSVWRAELSVTCWARCWQRHALKRISLATAIPPPCFFFPSWE